MPNSPSLSLAMVVAEARAGRATGSSAVWPASIAAFAGLDRATAVLGNGLSPICSSMTSLPVGLELLGDGQHVEGGLGRQAAGEGRERNGHGGSPNSRIINGVASFRRGSSQGPRVRSSARKRSRPSDTADLQNAMNRLSVRRAGVLAGAFFAASCSAALALELRTPGFSRLVNLRRIGRGLLVEDFVGRFAVDHLLVVPGHD